MIFIPTYLGPSGAKKYITQLPTQKYVIDVSSSIAATTITTTITTTTFTTTITSTITNNYPGVNKHRCH